MSDGRRGRNPPSWDLSRRCLDPLVDIREAENEVLVTADLPCVDRDDIEVRVKEDELILEAKMRREMRFESWGGAHRKISFNSFRKEISLPAKVDIDKTEAKFKNGILEVRLPKRDSKNSEKKIEIK